MAQVITRPGEGELTPILKAAYQAQDAVVLDRLKVMIEAMYDFANANLSLPVEGFDRERYMSLKRDARVLGSDLHRAMARWQSSS